MNGQPVLYLSSSIDGVHVEFSSSCKNCSAPLGDFKLKYVELNINNSNLKIVDLFNAVTKNGLLNITLDFCEQIKKMQ